jgi:hypothetical protein
MSEFEQYLNQFNQSLQKSREAYSYANDCFGTADGLYETLKRVRTSQLEEILKEKGLAVCAENHYSPISERYGSRKIEKPTAEDLGIFPRDQMKLRFEQGIDDSLSRELSGGHHRVLKLNLVCPKHFSDPPTLYTSEMWPDWRSIVSEAKYEDGKYLIMPEKEDVTGLIVWAQRARAGVRLEMGIDGSPFPNDFVYRYFGIPDLPEKPRLDKLK